MQFVGLDSCEKEMGLQSRGPTKLERSATCLVLTTGACRGHVEQDHRRKQNDFWNIAAFVFKILMDIRPVLACRHRRVKRQMSAGPYCWVRPARNCQPLQDSRLLGDRLYEAIHPCEGCLDIRIKGLSWQTMDQSQCSWPLLRQWMLMLQNTEWPLTGLKTPKQRGVARTSALLRQISKGEIFLCMWLRS